MRYKTIEELIDMIDRPMKTKIFDLYLKYKVEFLLATGSQHNHQEWEGGYLDHVIEVMNIARLLFDTMDDKRELHFSLSEALTVLFLHDIEKAFPKEIDTLTEKGLSRPKAKGKIRYRFLHDNSVWDMLSDDQKNAVDHAEGEGDGYVNTHRVMCPLAAFVNICDVTSARIWFDRPKVEAESWGWREPYGSIV